MTVLRSVSRMELTVDDLIAAMPYMLSLTKATRDDDPSNFIASTELTTFQERTVQEQAAVVAAFAYTVGSVVDMLLQRTLDDDESIDAEWALELERVFNVMEVGFNAARIDPSCGGASS